MDAAAVACEREVEIDFRPTARAQLAVWVTQDDRLATLALTDAVGTRGIGNRPGAYQMNSAFRWPYGRRWNVLPGWAEDRRRLDEDRLFRTVVFSDGRFDGPFEGHATGRGVTGSTPDGYFCQSFVLSLSRREGLDAMSCATPLFSDKGRYLPPDALGYTEPEDDRVSGRQHTIPARTPYPPRRDTTPHGSDHGDVASFASDALATMPELDAITMPTPPAGELVTIRWRVPTSWTDAPLRVSVEANTEGDYNDAYGPDAYPVPSLPEGAWDFWAQTYGYPYRGQPSVIFDLELPLPPRTARSPDVEATLRTPARRGTLDASMTTSPIDDTILDSPASAPGSGADRLLRGPDGVRVTARARQILCH